MGQAFFLGDSEISYKSLNGKVAALGHTMYRFDPEIEGFGSEKSFFIIDLASFSLGYEALGALLREYPLSAIALSPVPRFDQAVHLLKVGVKGYLNTHTAPVNLNQAIHSVLSGGMWFDPGVVQEMIAHLAVTESGRTVHTNLGLSEREMQIARYVAQGISNKEIASILDITERTVKSHLLACYQKLEVHNRVALALRIKRMTDV
ncbi:MAG: response regulator transcription factor [Sulfuricurvum sp.]|nr:response regulator transcription factor [Sulfuricurvum sp.]